MDIIHTPTPVFSPRMETMISTFQRAMEIILQRRRHDDPDTEDWIMAAICCDISMEKGRLIEDVVDEFVPVQFELFP